MLQVVSATTRRAAWRDSVRGLGAADLAMHVVLPELDGRILAGAVAFKDPLPAQEGLAFTALASRPEPDRIAMVADRIAALVRLRALPRGERRVAVLMPDYPGAPGRTGYAVGLDVPASVIALLDDLAAAGYAVERRAADAARLARRACCRRRCDAHDRRNTNVCWRACPSAAVARLREAWGEPADDPDVRDGAFRFRAQKFGKLWVALPPDRGRSAERRADYHDPLLPPRHALVAFGLWLQHVAKVDALVHMGAHGTLEWLPGKAVALTAECFPEIVTGPLPVIYPFIVSNPGEAAQAKRRIAGVTIGHLPPPLVAGGLSGEARELERLIDEYAQADGLDRRRRERLASLIVETAQRTGLAREAGIGGAVAPDDALRRIDAWLCDLKDLAIKDGLHIYGRAPAGSDDPLWQASAEAERAALIAALDGRRVAPGPAGAPTRGRRDVLPTGRNLFTADPRTLPTPTAMELGRLAADEVVRAHLQTPWRDAARRRHRSLGQRHLAHRRRGDRAGPGADGLPADLGARERPRHRHRGAADRRDGARAGRCHLAHFRPVSRSLPGADRAHRRRGAGRRRARRRPTTKIRSRPRAAPRGGARLDRIFGTAPGSLWRRRRGFARPRCRHRCDRRRLSRRRLAQLWRRRGRRRRGARRLRAARRRAPIFCVHPSDDPGRDLLEGAEDAAFVGGFAAAAKMLGRAADLVMLDVTDPQRPRARTLSAALARIVRGARGQSALHRRPDAPRPARRRRACRNRRPARRFRRNDRRGRRANCSISCTRPMSPIPTCAHFCCAKIRRPRRRSPTGSTPRAGAAFGIRAATTSMPASRRCARRPTA